MLIVIFGESCTGKTTLAAGIKAASDAEIYSGKDYLRLAKNEPDAKRLFQERLNAAVHGDNIIYIVAGREHLALIPDGAVRILVTAELEVIKERFAARMHGNLPAPVAAMLEKKHGCFDGEPHEFHVISGETDMEKVCEELAAH